MYWKTLTLVVVLLAGNSLVDYVRRGYSLGQVIPPERELSETSLRIGNWEGRDLPADPRIRKILRARSGVDRVYRNPRGDEALVHAVWTDDYLQLHFPQQCYREAGWELQSEEDLEVSTGKSVTFPVKVLRFTQGKKSIRVLYWFQLGEDVFLDRIQHRFLRRKVCWGKTEWPPLMKFMLETPESGLGRSNEVLTDLAARLHEEVFETTSASGPEPSSA